MLHIRETLRKAIHISSLLIPLGYRYILDYNRKLMFLILLAAFVVMLIVEFNRFWQRISARPSGRCSDLFYASMS